MDEKTALGLGAPRSRDTLNSRGISWKPTKYKRNNVFETNLMIVTFLSDIETVIVVVCEKKSSIPMVVFGLVVLMTAKKECRFILINVILIT